MGGADPLEAGLAVTLDFVADILCPWCYIARRRLDQACRSLAATGLAVSWVWRPYLLHADAPAGGTPQDVHLRRRFFSSEAAGRYHASVVEAGRTVGIAFNYERIKRTPSAVDAHRLLLAVEGETAPALLAEKLATAFFTEGADIGDRTALAEMGAFTGANAQAVRAMLDGDAFRAEVFASDRAAKRAGIAAVPAFCLHGRILRVPDPASLDDIIARAHLALASVQGARARSARGGHPTDDGAST